MRRHTLCVVVAAILVGTPAIGLAQYSTPFNDARGWTLSGLWAVDSSPSTMRGGAFRSRPSSLNYNNGVNYNVGTTSGTATSPPISIAGLSNPVLRFWCNYHTETQGTSWDKRHVRVRYNGTVVREYQCATIGGSSEIGLCAAMGTWHEHVLSLAGLASPIVIEFSFDSIGPLRNDYAGWFVEDVSVTSAGMPGITNGFFGTPPVEAIGSTNPNYSSALDVVIVGDGFAIGDQATFGSVARNIASIICGREPYRSNISMVNIWRVNVVSNNSGIDEVGVKRVASPFELEANPQTRLLLFTNATPAANIQAVLGHSALPDCDLAIFVGNTTIWCGAGYYRNKIIASRGNKVVSAVTSSRAFDYKFLAFHEMQHGMSLGDEYLGGGNSISYPNISTYVVGLPSSVKWRAHLQTNSIPTEDPSFSGVGAFDLAFIWSPSYRRSGLARPAYDDIMRSPRATSLCYVCQCAVVDEMRRLGVFARYPRATVPSPRR